MDANKHAIKLLQVERAIKALAKNNIEARFIPTVAEVVPTVASLMKEGESVAVGGSVTLDETGVLALLRNGSYVFYDRYKKGLTKDEINDIFIKSFSVDTYLSSANAITEHGEIYCVDGTSNRTAAMLYGPKQVVLVVSWDKIVPDLLSAVLRVKNIAAPANATRLNRGTYCTEHGKCMYAGCDEHNLMALGAGSCEHTICSNYVVFSHQLIEKRIKVLIVGESLGY